MKHCRTRKPSRPVNQSSVTTRSTLKQLEWLQSTGWSHTDPTWLEWKFLCLVYGGSELGLVVRERNATGLKQHYTLHPLGSTTRLKQRRRGREGRGSPRQASHRLGLALWEWVLLLSGFAGFVGCARELVSSSDTCQTLGLSLDSVQDIVELPLPRFQLVSTNPAAGLNQVSGATAKALNL